MRVIPDHVRDDEEGTAKATDAARTLTSIPVAPPVLAAQRLPILAHLLPE